MTYDSDHTSGPWDRRAHPDLGASPVPAGGDTTAPPRRDVVCATCDGLIWRLTIPVVPESPDVHSHHGAEFTQALQAHHARCDGIAFWVLDTPDPLPESQAMNDCPTCDGSGTVTTVRQTIFGPTAFRWRRHGVLPVREENRQPCPACGQDPNDKGRS